MNEYMRMVDRIKRAEEIQRYTENRCDTLEKENKELRLKLKEIEESDSVTELKYLRNANKSAERDVRNAYKNGKLEGMTQLTKAIEIIKELLDTQYQLDPYRDIFKDRILKAEQFLKEI